MFAKTELNLEVHIVEMVTEHNALNTASAYVVCQNFCANVKARASKTGLSNLYASIVCTLLFLGQRMSWSQNLLKCTIAIGLLRLFLLC